MLLMLAVVVMVVVVAVRLLLLLPGVQGAAVEVALLGRWGTTLGKEMMN